jgi:hypothetical protein
MSGVAAYHVSVRALFSVQGGMLDSVQHTSLCTHRPVLLHHPKPGTVQRTTFTPID